MASLDTVRTAASGLAQRLGDAFEAAPDHQPAREMRVGRATIRVEVAAEGADAIMPGLGTRLTSPTRDPDMTFRVFTDPELDPLGKAVTTGTESPRVTAMSDPTSGALCTWDEDERVGYFWCSRVEDLSHWDFGAPLRALFSWALPHFDMHLIHAAAVGTDEGEGVLLAGVGGSGKSTTAIICGASGMRILGDDYIVLDVSGDSLRVHAIYDVVKLVPDSPAHELVPDAEALLIREDGKAHIQLSDVLGAETIDTLIITGIAATRVGAQTGTPKKVSGQKTLLALAPSSILQLPGTQRDTFPALVRLCREVPAYELQVGPDIDSIPAAVSTMLP